MKAKSLLLLGYYIIFSMHFISAQEVSIIDCGELKIKSNTIKLIAVRNETEGAIVVPKELFFSTLSYSVSEGILPENIEIGGTLISKSISNRKEHISSDELIRIDKGQFYFFSIGTSVLNEYQKDKLYFSGIAVAYSKIDNGDMPLNFSKKMYTEELKYINPKNQTGQDTGVKGYVLLWPTDNFNFEIADHIKSFIKEKTAIVDIAIKVDDEIKIVFHLTINYQKNTATISLANNSPSFPNSDKSEYTLDKILETIKSTMEKKLEFQMSSNIQVFIIPVKSKK